MAKQSFSVGQVLTAAQMTSLQQTAMLGGSATAKTTSYTLVAADAGTVVSVNSTSATTITVNTGLFAAGDTVTIQNWGSGAVTITAGTATVNTAGSLIVPQYDGGVLYFTSASAAIYFDWVQAGATSPLTTKGDIWGYSTSDARIPVGANGTVLTADSAESLGLKWATPATSGFVGCLAYTSNQSITFTANVAKVITMGNEEFDTDGFHSTSTNTSRITIPTGKGGKYLLTAQWDIQAGGVNSYYMSYLTKNGTKIGNGVNRGGSGNIGDNAFWGKSFTTIADLVATDYIEFYYQTDLNGTAEFWLRFGAQYLGV